jgi:hypothetical protein
MKTQTLVLIRVSGMILLAVAVSIITLALVHALQSIQLLASLATIGWNG